MSHKESGSSFRRRVKEATGFEFDSIPHGDALDLNRQNSVLCRRGQTHVVRVAEPEYQVDRYPEIGASETVPVDHAEHFRVVVL